jgi:hypothetical protein
MIRHIPRSEENNYYREYPIRTSLKSRCALKSILCTISLKLIQIRIYLNYPTYYANSFKWNSNFFKISSTRGNAGWVLNYSSTGTYILRRCAGSGHVYGPTKKMKSSVLVKKENSTPIAITDKAACSHNRQIWQFNNIAVFWIPIQFRTW